MVIVKNVTQEADGSYSTSWSLTQEQVAFLVTYAINSLLLEGTLSVEEREANMEQNDFLKDVPVEVLGSAQ